MVAGVAKKSDKDSDVLSKTATNAEACAALASGAGKSTFLLGAFFRRGWCIAGSMKIDTNQYKAWQKNKEDPECSDGWKNSMLYDFYAIEPVADKNL